MLSFKSNILKHLKQDKSFFNIKEKKVKTSIKQLQLNYKSLMDDTIIGIYIIQDNFFRYVNKRWCEIHGYTYEEVVDKINPIDTVHVDDRELFKENLGRRISGETDFIEFEFRIIRKDKKIIWVKLLVNLTTYNKKPAITGALIEYTEQMHIATALLESEDKYRKLVEQSLVGVYIIQNNLFKYVNKRFGDIFGYASKEIINKLPPSVFVHKEDQKIVEENIRKRISEEIDSLEYEFRGVKKDGSIVYIKVLGNLMIYEGKPAITGTLVDFTERKLMENALRKSERRLRTLIDTIPDLIWLKDPGGMYLQCNQRFEQLYGAPEKEIIGKTDYDFVNQELADFFRKKDNEAKAAKKPLSNEEEVTFSDGHNEILETIKTPIYEYDGRFIGVLGIGRDITKRKQAEIKLKESEELFKILLKLAPYPIALTNLNNQYVLVNEAYYNINNNNESNIIGKKPEELGITFDTTTEKYIKKEMQSKGKVENVELSVTLNNGEKKDFLYSSLIIKWKNSPMIIHSSIDITQKKKTERELEKYRKQLELLVKERTEELVASVDELHGANEELFSQKEELQNTIENLNTTRKQLIQSEKMASLGILAAGVAHEINNPLNFINGGSLALKNYLEEKTKDNINEISPFLNAIDEGVKRATQIVASLGQYSKQNDLSMEECDIHSIIDNCLIMSHNQLKGKVTLIKNYTTKKHAIIGNTGRLHQALLNIISNAEQAIIKDGMIKIKTDVENNKLIIIIQDTGVGIKDELIEKIFDPFFTTKAPGRGKGLGLFIAFNIIKEHNGNIECESEPGKGTSIKIILTSHN